MAVDAASNTAFSVWGTIGLRDEAARAGLTRMGKAAEKFGREFGSTLDKASGRFTKFAREVSDQATIIGASLTAGITAPVAALGAGILKTSAEFEAGMNRVSALSGSTGGVLTQLTEQARKLGSETKFSATQAADAMSFLAQAGYDSNQILQSMPGLLDLAASGNLDLASAADIATDILSGFQEKADQTGRVVDVIAKTAASSNTSVVQLGQGMSFVASIADSVGLSIEETAAALGTLSNAGIKGMRAGTGLRGVISSLLKPSKLAAGTFTDLGVAFVNADGSARDVFAILGDLRDAGATATDMVTIFGREISTAATVLKNAGGGALKDFTAELNDAEGAAQQMATTMNQGLQGALTRLKSAFEGLQISIGDAGLRQNATALVEWAADLTSNLSKLNPTVLKTGTVLAGLAATVGPLVLSFGLLGKALAPGGLILTGLAAMKTALLGLLTPWGLVGTAITVFLGYGIAKYIEKMANRARLLSTELENVRKATGDANTKLADLKSLLKEQEAALEKLQEQYKKSGDLILKSEMLKMEKAIQDTRGEMAALYDEMYEAAHTVVPKLVEETGAYVAVLDDTRDAFKDFIDELNYGYERRKEDAEVWAEANQKERESVEKLAESYRKLNQLFDQSRVPESKVDPNEDPTGIYGRIGVKTKQQRLEEIGQAELDLEELLAEQRAGRGDPVAIEAARERLERLREANKVVVKETRGFLGQIQAALGDFVKRSQTSLEGLAHTGLGAIFGKQDAAQNFKQRLKNLSEDITRFFTGKAMAALVGWLGKRGKRGLLGQTEDTAAATGAGLVSMFNQTGSAAGEADRKIGKLKGTLGALGGGIGNLFGGFGIDLSGMFKGLWDGMKKLWKDYLKPTGQKLWETVRPIWTKFLRPVGEGIYEGIKTLWQDFLKPIGVGIFEGIRTLWSDFLRPIGEGIGKGLKLLWQEFLQPIGAGIWQGIKTLWQDFLKPIGTGIAATIKSLWSDFLKPVGAGIGNALKTLWRDFLKPVGSAIGSGIRALWSDFLKPIGGAIGGGLRTLWQDFLKPAAGKIWDGLKSLWTDFLSPLAGKIWDGLKALWQHFLSPILGKLWDGIKAVVKPLWEDFFAPAAGKLWDLIKGVVKPLWEKFFQPGEVAGGFARGFLQGNSPTGGGGGGGLGIPGLNEIINLGMGIWHGLQNIRTNDLLALQTHHQANQTQVTYEWLSAIRDILYRTEGTVTAGWNQAKVDNLIAKTQSIYGRLAPLVQDTSTGSGMGADIGFIDEKMTKVSTFLGDAKLADMAQKTLDFRNSILAEMNGFKDERVALNVDIKSAGMKLDALLSELQAVNASVKNIQLTVVTPVTSQAEKDAITRAQSRALAAGG